MPAQFGSGKAVTDSDRLSSKKAMEGHSARADKSIFQNLVLFEKYVCPACDLLLKDAVQTSCGHWGCESCVNNILATESVPRCHNKECREELLKDEDGAQYFKDRFVRREVQNLLVHCDYKDKGCTWGGKFRERDDHLKECEYNSTQCELCGQTIAASTAEDHKLRLCKNAVIDKIFGCSNKIENETKETRQKVNEIPFQVASQNQPEDLETDKHMDEIEHANHASESDANSKQYGNRDCACSLAPFSQCYQPHDDFHMPTFVPPPQVYCRESRNIDVTWMEPHLDGLKEEIADLNKKLSEATHKKDVEIAALKEKILQLEKIVRAKTAEAEQTDFRLSLIENSVYKPNMVWKIPQFSQRKADAESGKYTSIFSLPFYTGRYGYKMCLRLYILGDGIGKNTHMSLFFVVMRGEFDNILQWPFTHKVTFKLINQKGACDVVDTFQPDEMSNSFRKPKSDMNIASGCPRFVSHQELQNGGFIEDDTIFIALFVK